MGGYGWSIALRLQEAGGRLFTFDDTTRAPDPSARHPVATTHISYHSDSALDFLHKASDLGSMGRTRP